MFDCAGRQGCRPVYEVPMTAFRTVLIALIIVSAAGLTGFAFFFAGGGAVGGDKPYGVSFNLVDHNGKAITEKAFQEKPTAVFFGFTHCPEVCPTTLFEMDAWLDKVDPDGTHLQAFFVTVDPERDTHDILERYVTNVSDRVVGISGEPEKVRAMAKGFNVYFKKVPSTESEEDYVMDHTASVFLLNKGGKFHGTISYGEDGDVAVKKLQNLL